MLFAVSNSEKLFVNFMKVAFIFTFDSGCILKYELNELNEVMHINEYNTPQSGIGFMGMLFNCDQGYGAFWKCDISA